MTQFTNQIQENNKTDKTTVMKHVKTLNKNNMSAESIRPIGCGECQASCQSACKTSCTVANQKCENN